MFMQEVSACLELLPVKRDHEVQVLLTLLDGLPHLILVLGLRVVHSDIPLAEWSTWRRTHEPHRLLLVDLLTGEASITSLAEVPHGPIILARPEV